MMIKMTNDSNTITITIRQNNVSDDTNAAVIDCNKYLAVAWTDKNEFLLNAACDKTFIEHVIAKLQVVLFTQICNNDLGEILASLSAMESAFNNYMNDETCESFIIKIDEKINGGEEVC